MRFLFLTDTKIPSQRASAIHVRKLLPEFLIMFEETMLLTQVGGTEQWQDFPKDILHISVRIPVLRGGLFWLMYGFRKKLRKLSPDIIYSRFLLLPLFYSDAPYMLELHDDAWNKGKLFHMALKRAVSDKNCVGFVCISHAIKRDFEYAFQGLNKKVVVIEDAASAAPEEYSPVFHRKERLNLGYVGSFHKGKGLQQILEIATQLPEHDFTIIGGSNDQIDQLKLQGISHNVHFKGYIDHDLLWKEMEAIDICLLPNQSDVLTGKKSNIGKYTSPLKMFEYMAFSKPIVASDLSVLREVLDEDIAILVSSSDLNQWSDAIEKLRDEGLRRALGEAANKRFNKNYTWNRRANRIFDLINSAQNIQR